MRDIVNADCEIEKLTWKSTKGPENADGKRVAEMQAVLDVRIGFKNAKDKPWLESLFPGIDIMLQSIAGEEEHPGAKLTSKAFVPDQHVVLMRTDDAVVVDLAMAAVVNQPSINVNAHGEGALLMRLVAPMTADEVAHLLPYVGGADLRLNTASSQPELDFGAANGEAEGPSTRLRAAAG